MFSVQCSQKPQSWIDSFNVIGIETNWLAIILSRAIFGIWHDMLQHIFFFHFISLSYGLIWLQLSLDPIAMSINKGWNDKSKINVTRLNKKSKYEGKKGFKFAKQNLLVLIWIFIWFRYQGSGFSFLFISIRYVRSNRSWFSFLFNENVQQVNYSYTQLNRNWKWIK